MHEREGGERGLEKEREGGEKRTAAPNYRLPVLDSFLQLLQEVKGQSIELANVEKNIFSCILRQNTPLCHTSRLNCSMDNLTNQKMTLIS